MFIEGEDGSYNVITFLMLFPLVLFLILFLISTQHHFCIRNSVNDIANTGLDMVLTSGGLESESERYIKELAMQRNLDVDKLSIRASSTDPRNKRGMCNSDDDFVRRGHIISLNVSYKTPSMINTILGMVGVKRSDDLDNFSTTVHGMSQRWRKVENDKK